VRGLNSKGKQRYLKDRLKRDKPSIMMIQETRIAKTKLKEIMNNFNPYYETVTQDARGSDGGLTILWNPGEIIFEDWVSFPRILIGKFLHIGSKDWVILTGVYGSHIPGEKRVLLQNLTKLRQAYQDDLWIVWI